MKKQTVEYKGYKAAWSPEFFSRACGCMIDEGYSFWLTGCSARVATIKEFRAMVDQELLLVK